MPTTLYGYMHLFFAGVVLGFGWSAGCWLFGKLLR